MYVYRSALLQDVNAAMFIPLSAARVTPVDREPVKFAPQVSDMSGDLGGDLIGGCPPCLSPDWP